MCSWRRIVSEHGNRMPELCMHGSSCQLLCRRRRRPCPSRLVSSCTMTMTYQFHAHSPNPLTPHLSTSPIPSMLANPTSAPFRCRPTSVSERLARVLFSDPNASGSCSVLKSPSAAMRTHLLGRFCALRLAGTRKKRLTRAQGRRPASSPPGRAFGLRGQSESSTSRETCSLVPGCPSRATSRRSTPANMPLPCLVCTGRPPANAGVFLRMLAALLLSVLVLDLSAGGCGCSGSWVSTYLSLLTGPARACPWRVAGRPGKFHLCPQVAGPRYAAERQGPRIMVIQVAIEGEGAQAPGMTRARH